MSLPRLWKHIVDFGLNVIGVVTQVRNSFKDLEGVSDPEKKRKDYRTRLCRGVQC